MGRTLPASYGRLLFQDRWLVAVDKPTGIAVEARRTDDSRITLHRALGDVLQGDVRVVHRIDQPVSGVVLFARTAAAAASLQAAFQCGEVVRTYRALTERPLEPAAGDLIDHVRHDGRRNKTMVVGMSVQGAKQAKLRYRTLLSGDRLTLVEVSLITGRHHQIRAQLAHAGRPVRGDLKYGARRSLAGGGIDLHAHEVRLRHPVTGEDLRLTAAAPARSPWPEFLGMLEESPDTQSQSPAERRPDKP